MRGGLTRYALSAGKVVVRARSRIHDTTTTWAKLAGTVGVDPAGPAAGCEAAITVDMRELDAGDRLKNWKLRSDLEPDKHPEARFTLRALEDVKQLGDDRFRAVAVGTIEWRGRSATIRAEGTGRITAAQVDAEATFELDVRQLGVTPPKFFMLKVDPEVSVTVTLTAAAAAA